MATQYYPDQQAQPPQGQPLLRQPPSYNPGQIYQPQPVISAGDTVVATAQPTVAATTSVPPPEADNSNLAVGALVLSLVTMITCGVHLIYLPCIVPGLILAIVAMQSRGSTQKMNAGLSIGLSISVIAWVLLSFAIAALVLMPRRFY